MSIHIQDYKYGKHVVHVGNFKKNYLTIDYLCSMQFDGIVCNSDAIKVKLQSKVFNAHTI